MNRLFHKIKECTRLFWVRVCVIQILVLGVIGIWAISGDDVEIYQASNPDEVQNVVLPTGTYRAYITYTSSCEENAGTFISESNNPAFKADTLQFYSWENVDYLQLWALSDVSDVKFVYNRIDGDLSIEHISIAETKDYKRIIWTVLLSGMLLVDAGIVWQQKIKADYGSDKKKKRQAVVRTLALIGVGVVACYPLHISWLIPAHDVTFHLSRIEGIKEALLTGQFPVRMQPTWFEGAGYAVSIMYGDILLYIPAILRIMGFSLQAALKIYIVLITAGTIGCMYYALNKIKIGGNELNKWLNVIATAVYTLSLYRLGDVYIRQALGEYTAIMFYPLVFCGFYRIFYGDEEETNRRWLMPAIGMTGILTCHCISAIIVTFVLAIWCILECNHVIKKSVLIQIAKTVCMTILLSAGFLIPFIDYFFTQKMNINSKITGEISYIQQEGLQYADLFAMDYHGTNCKVYGSVYFVIAAVLFLLLVYSFLKKEQPKKIYFSIGKIFIMFLLSTWLATAKFPWNALSERLSVFSTISGTIQMPFRFVGIAMLFLSILVAYVGRFYVEKRAITMVVCTCCSALMLIVSTNYEINILEDNNRYRVYDAAGLGLHVSNGIYSTYIVCGGEYIPHGVDIGEYRWGQPVCDEGVLWQNMQRDGASLSIITANTTDTAKNLSVPLLYYKGYQARNIVNGTELSVFGGNNGMATVQLPVGYEGEILFEYVSPWYWRLSEVVTLLAVGYILRCIYKEKYKNGR